MDKKPGAAAVAINTETGASRAVRAERTPKPGEYSICVNCATICVFTDEGALRVMSPFDMQVLQLSNPVMWRNLTRLAIQTEIRSRMRKA